MSEDAVRRKSGGTSGDPPGESGEAINDAHRELQGAGIRSEAELTMLETEVRALRARVAQLEAEKAALLRAAADRDYERPPHY